MAVILKTFSNAFLLQELDFIVSYFTKFVSEDPIDN